jgi:hypothetical protein
MGLFVKDNLVGPTNIWFDENGELLVSDYDGTAVKRFDAEGNYVSDYLTGLSQSEGVAYLPNGNILMGNGKTHSVKQFDPAGNYINDLVPDGAGGLKTPNAVVIHSGTSAVENMSIANSFSINPTAGFSFLIDDLGASEDTVHCEIFNMAGAKVDEFRFKDQIQWDGSKFPKGTYQIRIYQQDRYCIKQIVISY